MSAGSAREGADDIVVGVVVGAHGLKGEVKVKTFTLTPDAIGSYGPLASDRGHRFAVAALRAIAPDSAIVKFDNVSDRNAAEALKGAKLSVPRSALPKLEEGEFYPADLIGLSAKNDDGILFGTVRGVYNFGAGDVIEIEEADGSTQLYPFNHDIVPVIDLDKKILILRPPRELE